MRDITDNSSIDLSLTNVWKSWVAFRKDKKPSREIIFFESDLEKNLLSLCAELNNGRYRHGGYNHRIINEKKRRDISVASVKDRVVHRLLYDYLVPYVDPRLDYDVWSCRKNKGLHKALLRTHELSSRYSHAWIWRADISKFFDNVDQQVLGQCIKRFVEDAVTLGLIDKVIGSYITIKSVSQSVSQSGIPIGNLTSQIFANIYLNEFDRFVRNTIKPLGYVRYGDDFVIFLNIEKQANKAKDISTKWLFDTLKLNIHIKNNVIIKAKYGLHFLGHWIYPTSNIVIDSNMANKIVRDINSRNASSYGAMYLTKRQKRQLSWLLKDI